MNTWEDLFSARQLLTLDSFTKAIREVHEVIRDQTNDPNFSRTVATCLGLAVDRLAERLSTLSRWHVTRQTLEGLFSKQALAMIWDFAEGNPFSGATGDWDGAIEWITKFAQHVTQSRITTGQAHHSDARDVPLPDQSVSCVFTDPPYYDQIPYSDLSDFFAEWLVRTVGHLYPDWFDAGSVRKEGDLVVNAGHMVGDQVKNGTFFRSEIAKALTEFRRVLDEDGVGVIVFAHKETEGWEALLAALIDAGWTVTASWPIETEMATRSRARRASSLQSSVHIGCRPRRSTAGIGDWREVRGELDRRVADWLPRLSEEGIEGADAIFACLGPAMEVYSRFERVETAAGEAVPLTAPEDELDAPAFLPAVWSAVARSALALIFEGGEAQGFEEDARLTALWLWTLRAATNGESAPPEPQESGGQTGATAKSPGGFALDYDTARKLAQALGAHLEDLGKPGGIVEVKGAAARLLAAADRRRVLLGDAARMAPREASLLQGTEDRTVGEFTPARTALGRLHQAMLLFADGHGETLRRLLAEGADEGLRRLARALSPLYPPSSQEKKWLDGVLGAMRQIGGSSP